MHIRNIYADRELDENRTYKKFLLVRQEGNRQVIIYNRVDNKKPFVGMTNFKGNYVTRDDVKIAKNYLSEIELQRLNLLVSGFLDFAEFQALEMNPMTMKDCIEALDNQIIAHKRKVLIGKGNVSHKQAIEKAEKEGILKEGSVIVEPTRGTEIKFFFALSIPFLIASGISADLP